MNYCPKCDELYFSETCDRRHGSSARGRPPTPLLSPLPPPAPRLGDVCVYERPEGSGPVLVMITDISGDTAGVMVLGENVRADLDDLKEIPDGEPTP